MSDSTTTRITRQLRALRNKCTALNSLAIAPPKPTVTVTYGRSGSHTRRPTVDDSSPPLAILQSVEKLGARLHYDRTLIQNLQLSKRIYEVRDAFKNIVQSSLDNRRDSPECTARTLSLTSICARIVGQLAQSEADAAVREDPHSEGREDDIRSSTIDELYENVPAQHRRFTLVAHALTHILEACPHYPTLLNALLEVCITHGLEPESRTILGHFFTFAILPRSDSSPCPLAHPTHKNFLISLRDTCVSASPHNTLNNQTYTSVLVDALSQSCSGQMHAWTSKAVTKFARDLREHDFEGCFVPLCSGLAYSVSQKTKLKAITSKHRKILDDATSEEYAIALERLAKWVGSMLDRLHSPAAAEPEYRACVDFLVHIEPLGLHISTEPATSPATCLADAICCLAANCLASPLSPAPTPDLEVLDSLLRTAHIKNTTFDNLVSRVFPPKPGDNGVHAIDTLVDPLHRRSLLLCEVSLYISAMQHVEEIIAAPAFHTSPSPGYMRKPISEKELFRLRLQLMDRVEDAERRCYGGGGARQDARQEQEWVWEDVVGSWVIKSPAVVEAKAAREQEMSRVTKRRRIDNGRKVLPPLISTVARTSRNKENLSGTETDDTDTDSWEGALTPAPKRVRTHAAVLSNSCQNAMPHHYGRGAAGKGSEKLRPRTSAPARLARAFAIPQYPAVPAPARHRVNFATALADSQKNTISLREERARREQRQSLLANRKRPLHALTSAEVDPSSSPMRNANVEPSSDDALNLFAYPDSSPIKVRSCES